MLTGRRILFIGGDARIVEVIAQVSELDAAAQLVGFEQLRRVFVGAELVELTTDAFAHADAVVLPIAGVDDAGGVESRFSEQSLSVQEQHFRAMQQGSLVFTGIARPRLEEMCAKAHVSLVKLMALDEVAILNSIPTAEGAIAMAMERTDITIHGSTSVVVGFGRCGQTLVRSLHALGATVRVVARSAAQLARIREMGVTPFSLTDIEAAVADADIVFNTVPMLLLGADVLSGMRREVVIIDIASDPGGTDFRYAEKRGMRAVLAPSLPGRVAPRTAGRIVADSICRILANSRL